MSRESEVSTPQKLSTKLLHAVLPWLKPRPRPAHPWTAYKPTTYLAGNAPEGIIIATKAAALVAPPGQEIPTAAAVIQKPIRASSPATVAAGEAVLGSLSLVVIAKASSNAYSLTEPSEIETLSLPGIAAHTGKDFQLAARLRSVAHFNRKSAPLKAQGLGQEGSHSVRRRKVAPPAILRKKSIQQPGQVIRLADRRAKSKRVALRIAA